MPLPLEQYGFIGDLQTGALVGTDGSIDWLCVPRFDSGACFAALLGTRDNGRWQIAPAGEYHATRRYRGDSLVLETEFRTASGVARVVDAMPVPRRTPVLVRRVEGVSGTVEMRFDLVPRFDYGSAVPWLRRDGRRVEAIAGPDRIVVDSDRELSIADDAITCALRVGAGDTVDFRLGWVAPRQEPPEALHVGRAIEATQRWWDEWASHCRYQGPYRDLVVRSLVTLKGLIYQPSGGIVAALTTSVPEKLGGVRNWDYRYCWIRDATYTLLVLVQAGYTQEAAAWREWLVRALAGRPDQMQIMYGIEGERRLSEVELDYLPGYQGARPVRIGNAASGQLQWDVFGELMDALHHSRRAGLSPEADAWRVQRRLLDYLESNWREPDDGIWETRGPRRDFTHSKVMAWVAVDRGIKAVEAFGLSGPMARWRRTRDEIFNEVCEKGFNPRVGAFTQYYGSSRLDASLLLMAPVGFLPSDDERVVGTVDAIDKGLCHDGFVRRYDTSSDGESGKSQEVDGLPPGEGAFLACTFWLADNYALRGRLDRAREIFERVIAVRNDLGLLAEEYDVEAGRMVGNIPQALSHLQLVSTAAGLATAGEGPSSHRAGRAGRVPTPDDQHLMEG